VLTVKKKRRVVQNQAKEGGSFKENCTLKIRNEEEFADADVYRQRAKPRQGKDVKKCQRAAVGRGIEKPRESPKATGRGHKSQREASRYCLR